MNRKRILYILHSYYNRAGTEEHTRDLATGLASRFDVFIAFPDKGRVVLMQHGEEIRQYDAPLPTWPVTPYRSAPHEDALDRILEEVKPDIIHIQHFLHWPLGVIDKLVQTTLPVVMSFHDYYPFTPDYTMRGVEEQAETLSEQYSKAAFGEDLSGYLRDRREIITQSVRSLRARIAPSRFLAELITTTFGEQCAVIEHGIQAFEVKPALPSDYIRFGYVGSLIPQKGYESAIEAFRLAKQNGLRATLHVFGDGAYAKKPAVQGIRYHGNFTRSNLSEIMSQFDIGIIPSVFRESYCFVLSEMWHAGKKVIAARIGAIPERMEHGKNGLLFVPGAVQEMSDIMIALEREGVWKSWIVPRVRYLDEMLESYATFYSAHI